MLKGEYNNKQGLAVRCRKCHKIVTKEFIRAFDGVWHRECFLCAGCDQPIVGQYLSREQQPWHADCFKKAFVPECVVCNKSISKRYLQDYWGNRYCLSHKHYATCTSCSRVVCGNVTGGGLRFPDGLTICNLCSTSGVTSQSYAEQLIDEMREALKSLGLNLFQAATPMRLVDRDQLHKHSRHDHHNEHPLLGLAIWSTSYVGKRVVGRDFREILVQKHLPEAHFRTVAIHELTHAWFFYNNPKGVTIPLEVEEGMCVLVEYLWLQRQNTEDAKYRMQLIKACQDNIYGKGFQRAWKAKQQLPLSALSRYVLEHQKFPSWLSAFFYE